jgi:GDPmannose 4,6-dehydratase
VARIRHGLAKELRIGNVEAKRDWGYAGDYVVAMHRMLQREAPSDYVIGTGETHSVREFCEIAFARAGLEWQRFVVTDPKFFRPAEVELLVGDARKAEKEIAWKPAVGFRALVEKMVDADLARVALDIERSKIRIP